MNAKNKCSIVARITLFTGVVAAILSTLLAVVMMVAIHSLATGSLIREVHAISGRVAQKVEQYVQGYVELPGSQVRNIQIVDPRGQVVASTTALRGKPPMAEFGPGSQGSKQAVVCDGVFGADKCDIVVAQSARWHQLNWTVYASSPVVPWWIDPQFAGLLGGSAIILVVAVTYLANQIAIASLRPVGAIRRELDEINATCPGRRVPVPIGKCEISYLAKSINHTLTRLQGAMERQRQFAADASHDLRSPIAAMRAEVEDAMLASPEGTMNRTGRAVLSSLDRLEAIVSDLLTIAKLDAGAACNNDPVDLAELAEAECGRRHHVSKTIVCRLEPDVVVLGDRLRLGRLLTNLLDNAERHAESTITVSVQQADSNARGFPYGVAVLEVIDDGPGIELDKRELVFQRFARLDAARNKDAGGTGLGLAIARQIAEAHGGTLRIEDSDCGARFVLRLPRHRETDPHTQDPGQMSMT
ncbi:sensor histidine kinase [Planotetraspora kaengkrachanensis]|uniref:histidine kinase n=1 Tax=Planotetraspora kaengkrachanensis TaxID=575193 RepID=A0A8J3PRC1_9ACTN|nr:HAMP domain-containing sensor histidine kinase [Planotetraspora kaengkrachanensis]GIG79037.1 two-component sensor histidine kinase [Planotetraspora kaengkrachanensis]